MKSKQKENPLNLFKFVSISSGKFLMGSPEDEKGRYKDENQVEVEITKPFEMQETQVTQLQYFTIMEINPATYEGMQKPVHNVSWSDTQKFISKMNELDSEYTYRLPTEAEWEYSCRAGTTTSYSWDDKFSISNYAKFNSNNGPVNVKSLDPNPWGLYDMHGNVWEWTSDWYGETLPGGVDPKGPDTGSLRVVRGGSWSYDARGLRSAYRFDVRPARRSDFLGFRLVRTRISPSSITLLPVSRGETHKSAVEATKMPEGWKRLQNKWIGSAMLRDVGEVDDNILAILLMKEMAEALEESEKFVGDGDCKLRATKAFLALKKFKEWK